MQTETAAVVAPVETTPVAPVTTVVADKAPKAPKAKAPKATPVAAKGFGLQLADEIITLAVEDVEAKAEDNVTRRDVGLDPAYVVELAASIKAMGQLTPVIVQKVKGEFAPYRIVAGYHRLAAIKSLGLKTVKAQLELTGTDSARVLGNVVENLGARKEVTALGAALGVDALLAEGHTFAEIAALMGTGGKAKAEDYVRDLGRISKGADEVREALAKGDDHEDGVTWAVARLVLRFSKAEQAALLRRVQKLSVVKAREVLADYRAAKSGKAAPSEADEGEGEESRDSSSKSKSGDHDAILPEAKVVKATVPFVGTLGLVVEAMRQAVANGDLAEAEKVANVLAKAVTRQEKELRALLTDKVFEAAEKEIAAKAKAAAK